MPVSVSVISAVDPVLGDTAVAVLSCDLPDLMVIRYQALPELGGLRRTVSSGHGPARATDVEVGHCLTCGVREDARTVVDALAADGVARIAIAVPPTMDPVPICFTLQQDRDHGVLASSMAVVDANSLVHDLLGSDLLIERGLGFGAHDRRAVGEALARQIETADTLAFSGQPDARAVAVLDHVVGPIPRRGDLHELDASGMFARRRPPSLARRGDLRVAAATGAPDAEGVWTLDLQSWRPFHPPRLQAQLDRLGSGRLRGRGYFWLPSRPQVQCAWDGAGGQLAIGELDRWAAQPHTRLVITGIDQNPLRVRRAFNRSLMTDVELVASLGHWQVCDDGFDEWLGARDNSCDTVVDLLAEED